MIDEVARRRLGVFREGRRVTLADGQQWHIPRPMVMFTPPDDGTDSGFTETLTTADPGGRYLELVKLRRDAEGDFEFIGAEVQLIRYLLQWNYDLSNQEVGQLAPVCYLDSTPDEEGNAEEGLSEEEVRMTKIREEIMKVVRGAAPKRRPAGTESSPTPAA